MRGMTGQRLIDMVRVLCAWWTMHSVERTAARPEVAAMSWKLNALFVVCWGLVALSYVLERVV